MKFAQWLKIDETLALKGDYKGSIFQRLVAAKYKLASGEEAKSLVSQLKDLTKEKKRLEDILNPKIDNEEDL
jgi:hypothetical protein